MLSVPAGEDVEASALSRRGWSISAIARHLDRDRKTVRSYLAGERVPGPAARRARIRWPVRGVAARFADDSHLWASVLLPGPSCKHATFAEQVPGLTTSPAARRQYMISNHSAYPDGLG